MCAMQRNEKLIFSMFDATRMQIRAWFRASVRRIRCESECTLPVESIIVNYRVIRENRTLCCDGAGNLWRLFCMLASRCVLYIGCPHGVIRMCACVYYTLHRVYMCRLSRRNIRSLHTHHSRIGTGFDAISECAGLLPRAVFSLCIFACMQYTTATTKSMIVHSYE